MSEERQIPFPAPLKVGRRNFWTKGAIRRWRAAKAGLPEPHAEADDEDWLASASVKEILGGVSEMWLWRRMNANKALHNRDLPEVPIVADSDANARLIAAAPDLLAVLQGILEDTADITDGDLAVRVLSEIRASIRAVIAKATGEA